MPSHAFAQKNVVLRIAREARVPASFASDIELLDALLANDAAAWRIFSTRYSRLIQTCIRRVLASFRGVVSTDAVDDIYASFSMQLLANDKRKLRSFEPERGTRLSSWIGMLAIRATYDYLRAVRREPCKDSLTEAEAAMCPSPDPFELCSTRERARVVTRLLEDLSAKDRQFVHLYYGEGLETNTIATRMGISFKTVYSKKHKIRARLEELMSLAGPVAA